MKPELLDKKAREYLPKMSEFLRDLIAIPGESAEEKEVIRRIKKEMLDLDFDEVEIDPMGNILGFMGDGEKIIAYDAHIDTVGIGNRENWELRSI